MPISIKDLGLDQLSAADRLRLAEELWDTVSIEPETPFELTEAHRLDLRRRLDAYRDDSKAGQPRDEVTARLRRCPPTRR